MKRTLLWLVAGLVLIAVGLLYAANPAAKHTGATGAVAAGSKISLKLSGPGAVNDSTIKVGQKVSMDLYFSNDKDRRGFTAGFKVSSPDIKSVIHPADSGKGVNDNGDIKAYNGWQDASVWDLRAGVLINKGDWDGTLPDYFGVGGVAVKMGFKPQESAKQLSFDLIVPTPGTLVVDSVFFPPAGTWKYADGERPQWGGPYKFKVVQ